MTTDATDTADVSEGSEAPASAVATLFPGYFALVMATGIIAIGAHLEDLDWLGQGLYVVAALAYVVIAALTTLRLRATPACSSPT